MRFSVYVMKKKKRHSKIFYEKNRCCTLVRFWSYIFSTFLSTWQASYINAYMYALRHQFSMMISPVLTISCQHAQKCIISSRNWTTKSHFIFSLLVYIYHFSILAQFRKGVKKIRIFRFSSWKKFSSRFTYAKIAYKNENLYFIRYMLYDVIFCTITTTKEEKYCNVNLCTIFHAKRLIKYILCGFFFSSCCCSYMKWFSQTQKFKCDFIRSFSFVRIEVIDLVSLRLFDLNIGA